MFIIDWGEKTCRNPSRAFYPVRVDNNFLLFTSGVIQIIFRLVRAVVNIVTRLPTLEAEI